MNIGTIIVAIIGVLGTLLAPAIAQYLSRETELKKWKREQLKEFYKDKRALYRDFITAAVDLFTTHSKHTTNPLTEFQRFSSVTVEIELSCPTEVVKAADKVRATFKEIEHSQSDIELFRDKMDHDLQKFITVARLDVLEPYGVIENTLQGVAKAIRCP